MVEIVCVPFYLRELFLFSHRQISVHKMLQVTWIYFKSADVKLCVYYVISSTQVYDADAVYFFEMSSGLKINTEM